MLETEGNTKSENGEFGHITSSDTEEGADADIINSQKMTFETTVGLQITRHNTSFNKIRSIYTDKFILT